MRPLGYFLAVFEGQYGAAKSVFEGDEAGGGKVGIR